MKLAFTTIRSAVLCVRGSRSLRNKMCIDMVQILKELISMVKFSRDKTRFIYCIYIFYMILTFYFNYCMNFYKIKLFIFKKSYEDVHLQKVIIVFINLGSLTFSTSVFHIKVHIAFVSFALYTNLRKYKRIKQKSLYCTVKFL